MKRSVPVLLLAAAFLVCGGAITYASIKGSTLTKVTACSTRAGVLSLEHHGHCGAGLVRVTLPLSSAGNGTAASHGASATQSTVGTQGAAATPATVGTASGGPTTITQQPAFTQLADLPAGQVGFPASPLPLSSPSSSSTGDEVDFWNLDTFSASSGTSTLSENLISPSEIAGAATQLSSVSFCWGEETTRSNGVPNSLSIDKVSVVEYTEPAASATGTYYAPAYTETTLLSSPLSLTDGAGCQTATASSPQTVVAGGFLKLEIQVTWNMSAQPQNANNTNQTTLELGRATVTYSG